jgi:hypothetical protein
MSTTRNMKPSASPTMRVVCFSFITAEIIAALPSSGGNRDRTALSVFRCHGDGMDQTSLVDVRTPIHPAHPPPIILHDHLWPRRVESGSHSVQVPLKASDTVPYCQR